MDIDDFGCLGLPTPLEMWKQHAALVTAELEEHLVDLRRMREKVARLIVMNDELTSERDRLQAELSTTTRNLSEAYRQLSMTQNTLAGYAMARDRALNYAESYAPPAGQE